MNCNRKLLAALGLCSASLFCLAPVDAGAQIIKQDYPSGQHVYRVEIRNLKWLEVLEAGDSDGEGELSELVVQLTSHNPNRRTQYDGEKYTGTQLYLINKGGIVSGRRNMPIRVGHRVKLMQNQRPDNKAQFWTHIYYNPNDRADIDRRRDYAGLVNLRIGATELDCAGQRICGRNNKGSVSISFRIPEFTTQPSNRCGPSNTFRLEPLDGELQVSGLSGSSVFSSTSSESWYLGVKYDTGGPRLRPFNADICIARTWSTAVDQIRQPTKAERDAARRHRRRN